VVQHAKCIKIWGTEGRLGHVEVFLQMCCFVTSIFERPRLFYAFNTPRSQNRSTPKIPKSQFTYLEGPDTSARMPKPTHPDSRIFGTTELPNTMEKIAGTVQDKFKKE